MLQRGEVGCRALNDHGNYVVDHGKIMERSWNFVFEFLWEPCLNMHAQLSSGRVPMSSGNPGKPGKSLKKSSMHGNIMELQNT